MGIETILETTVGAGPVNSKGSIKIENNGFGANDSVTVDTSKLKLGEQWDKGLTSEESAQNLLDALQASTASVVVDSAIDGTDLAKINLKVKVPGVSGDSIVLTKNDLTSGSRLFSFLAGGTERNALAFFGVHREHAANVVPGGVELCSMVIDPDTSDVYIFGGFGFNEVGSGNLSGLFKFSQALQQWSWVAGSKLLNQLTVYGTLGTATPGAFPGASDSHSMWWLNNKIYIGFGFGYDVDGFDPAINHLFSIDPFDDYKTTWLGGSQQGSQNGVLVTALGVHDPGNFPGGRQLAAEFVSGGKLYLVGGQGYGLTTGVGELMDIWSYLPGTGAGTGWACLTSNNEVNPVADYGTKGVEAPTNQPAGRHLHGAWGVIGNKIYTGFGEISGFFFDNVLWSFDLTSLEWTWEEGSSVNNAPGVYSGVGITPGARQLSAYSQDDQGRILLHGGSGIDEAQEFGRLDDVFRFDPTVVGERWEFLIGRTLVDKGSVYTPPGEESDDAAVGGRKYGRMAFGLLNNKVFLFAGDAFDESGSLTGDANDLWSLNLSPQTNFTLDGFDGGLDGDEPASLRWELDDDRIFHFILNDEEFFTAAYDTVVLDNQKSLHENLTTFFKLIGC